MRSTGPLVLLVVLGGLFLMGALPWSQPQAKKTLLEEPSTVIDPAATLCLDKAIQAMATPRLTVVETTVWQRLQLGELEVEAEGRFLQGPGQRYRLELSTKTGKRTGSLLQISDGDFLWQGTCYDIHNASTGWEDVCKTPLENTSGSPLSLAPHERPSGERAFAFTGVQPLLKNLKKNLIWTKLETLKLGDKECQVITGTWYPALKLILAPPDKGWPIGLPQQCRLWFDSRSYWPCRVEWLGSPPGNSVASVMVEMELRNPQLNLVLSETRMEREFQFDPGKTPVRDFDEPAKKRMTVDGFLP